MQIVNPFPEQNFVFGLLLFQLKLTTTNQLIIYLILQGDSQSSLLSLTSHTVNSTLVNLTIDALNYLAYSYNVFLFWVPGHEGIPGNELADRLARLGTSSNTSTTVSLSDRADNRLKKR